MRILALILALAADVTALAAEEHGVIEGHVVDETGSPIAGVRVSATRLQPGRRYPAASSDAKGAVRLELSPGVYELRAEMLGFAPALQPGIAVAAGATLEVRIEMTLMTLEELMKLPIITATKTPQRVPETPAVMTVITAEQIRDRGYGSVAEALRTVPGLSIWEDNLISSVTIRGINSVRGWSQTLKIMIDGQPVSFRTGYTHFIDPEMIPIRAVERIEVIRGPASTLYGANAYLGVVNVITKDLPRAGSEPALSVGVTGGGELFSSRGKPKDAGGEFLAAGRVGELALLASGAYLYSDRSGLALPDPVPLPLRSAGASKNDIARPVSFFGKAAFKDFTLFGGYQRLDRYGEFTDFSVLTHENRISVDNWFVRAEYRRPIASKGAVSLFLARAEGAPTRSDHLDTGSPRFWIKRQLGVRSWDTGTELRLEAGSRTSLVGGADYTSDDQQLQNNILVFKDGSGERYQNPGVVLGRKRFDNFGAYLQGIVRPRQDLSVTLGGRLDSHNVYGTVFNGRVAGVYAVRPSVHAKLLYATSFKAPTPRELYDVAGTSRGDPDLKPQRARTLEAAVVAVSGKFGASANVFLSRLKDVIKLATPSRPEPGVQKVFANIAEIDSHGLEAEVRYAGGRLQGYANVSYQHSEEKDTRLETTLVPEITANAGLGRGLSRRLVLNWETSFVGPKRSPKPADLAYEPPLADRVGFEVGSYGLSSVTLTTRDLRLFGGRETQVTLGIRDLFDAERVDPGYENRGIDVPHTGRTFFARLVQQF